MRDVVSLSRAITKKRKNPRFLISLSVISNVENGKSTPSLYALAVLAESDDQPISALLSLYGIC
jgi:hypothetical protein